MKTFFTIIAFTLSVSSFAQAETVVSYECSHWNVSTRTNGQALVDFKVLKDIEAEQYFIKFRGSKEMIPAESSEFGPFLSFNTGTEKDSIEVSVRWNWGAHSPGQIQYGGEAGNFYVDGVESYEIICGTP